MKDIKIDTPFMKIQYFISWIGFILFGGWVVALFLASYGKTTSYDVENEKGFLNKTWQKFAFIQGSIFGDIFLISLFVDLMI